MAIMQTNDYITTLYDVEDHLYNLKNIAVHDFAIRREDDKSLVVEVFIYKQNDKIKERLFDVFEKAKKLASMAVHVQKFPKAIVRIRYYDRTSIPGFPDMICC